MARRMITKYARNMTPKERQVCANMSYRGNGDLIYFLHDAMEYQDDTLAVLYKDDDKIVGWGLMTPEHDTGFWVRPSHRRQGIGTKMISRFKKAAKSDLLVHPHNQVSGKFFYKNGFHDEAWSYAHPDD